MILTRFRRHVVDYILTDALPLRIVRANYRFFLRTTRAVFQSLSVSTTFDGSDWTLNPFTRYA